MLMLAEVSPLRSYSRDESGGGGGGGRGGDKQMEADNFSVGADIDFSEFSCLGNLLDSIDFDDLFVGIHDGDGGGGAEKLLPADLEMDSELFAEFSVSSPGGCGSSEDQDQDLDQSSSDEELNAPSSTESGHHKVIDSTESFTDNNNYDDENNNIGNINIINHNTSNNDQCNRRRGAQGGRKVRSEAGGNGKDETTESCRKIESESVAAASALPQINHPDRRKKSPSSNRNHDHDHHNRQAKNSFISNRDNENNNDQATAKRRTKVDWTTELHRRFVQAVEQLGVDKAVPSRILEIMGIDSLTRHNVASHLQKYRSHRKHVLAREAEAATWSIQKRQMCGVALGLNKRNMHQPWQAPIMGFPPPVRPMHPSFRPLHVWGHPPMEMWPKHIVPSPSPTPAPAWAPPPHHPAIDPSFWRTHHQRVPHALAHAPTPCFSQPLPAARLPVPPVPGIPPHAMYKTGDGISVRPTTARPCLDHPPPDFHPSKEIIDAAIGDVIAKPWLPLPIGLKPPSVDSVLVELQRQGVPKIPPPTPTCA